MRNDPARLEAEAQELLDQMQRAQEEPAAADTPQEPEEMFEPPPSEPEVMEEASADEVPTAESSGDDSDVRLEKAERAMKGAQRRMTQATTEAAELRKQNESLMQSLTELKGQLVESQRDNEKLGQLREEYPDIASPLLDELQRTQAEVSATKEALAEQERLRQEEVQRQELESHFARIREVHPDFQDVTNTSDWALWLEDQDAAIHQWVESGTSNDVNAVLSRFKAEMGIKAPTPQEQSLERARSVAEPKMPKARKTESVSKKKVWSVDEITQMPNEVFEKHQSEIMDAYADGRIR